MDIGEQLAVPARYKCFVVASRGNCAQIAPLPLTAFPLPPPGATLQFPALFLHVLSSVVVVFCQSKCCPSVGTESFCLLNFCF